MKIINAVSEISQQKIAHSHITTAIQSLTLQAQQTMLKHSSSLQD